MDIETAATTAIKEKIANTDRLSQYINERDKEPIWDGSIYVYKNESRKSDNFIGRIPVQVKGKMVKSNILEKDKIKYSVPTRNLEKYRDEGGVIYFVVYVSENAKKRIYYASLLPYILNKYINNAHGKEVSIILKRLPEESHDFENLVNNFINDRKKQRTVQDGRNKSINEIAKLLGKDNIKLTINYMDIGNYELDPISSLMNNETLETAANLSKWLTEKEPDNLIHYINLYQCYRRQRKLTDDETHKLCRLLEEDGINDSIKVAAYILLDSKQLADMYIDKLDNKEIKTFVDFPIYYLYEKLK